MVFPAQCSARVWLDHCNTCFDAWIAGRPSLVSCCASVSASIGALDCGAADCVIDCISASFTNNSAGGNGGMIARKIGVRRHWLPFKRTGSRRLFGILYEDSSVCTSIVRLSRPRDRLYLSLLDLVFQMILEFRN